jgi:hypothetical protein
MANTIEDLINSDPEWKRRYELIRKLGASIGTVWFGFPAGVATQP